jgi:hypothetical protein
MAMTDEQVATFISRVSDGENFGSVLSDMEISREDFREWRAANNRVFAEARRAGRPEKVEPTKGERLTKLQRIRDRLTAQLERINDRIAEMEAEDA